MSNPCLRILSSSIMLAVAAPDIYASNNTEAIEEVTVISERLFSDTTRVSPTSKITAHELKAINMLTAEDAIAYEPSLVVRRRYVGDPNGVVGVRGSGMFQTARSLVFADGLPLHYLLQTRWSGAPRWSLVGPNELESAEVIYGPYSAEYSGNAMGGVVDLKTRTPTKRKFTVQGNLMSQDYDHLGTDEHYDGNKLFASYEDKIGDLAVFASYNRLKNDSQPMTNYSLDASDAAALDAAGVTGYIRGKNDSGEDVIYIGDSGEEVSTTELYKLKLSYDLGNMQLRGTIAYEDRTREEKDKNNYLVDASGGTYWGMGNRNFEERDHERNSLLLGFGISAELNENWYYDIYATDFEIKKDEEVRSGLSTDDPTFGSRDGRLTKYGDTGWNTLDFKLGTDNLFGNDAMRLSLGYYFDQYELSITPSNIDATTGGFVSARSESRGETSTQALFAQWGMALNEHWDLALGVRYEDWETDNGFYDDNIADDRSETGTSPKFSLAYTPNDLWSFRYSLAKALRFPISEELYRNDEAATSIIVADASLEPEEGLHHNFSIERQLQDGSLRLNAFYEVIDDNIYYQSGTINDGGVNRTVTTFLSLDEVTTRGLEFVLQKHNLFEQPLSLRFNVSYTDSEITENKANPAIENNDLPRVPHWRSNAILTYALNATVDVSGSVRYASNSHGDLDNQDKEDEVYGAIDEYFFVNAKLGWQMSANTSLSLGVDNVFDERAYVAHPWPSRTVFLEGRYSFD